MKKIFTLCCLFAAALANAQTIKTFCTEDPNDGYQVQDISNNGKYIGGVTMQNMMFIMDVESGKVQIKEMADDWGGEVRGVSNTGVGAGYNGSIATLSVNGDYKVVEEATEEFYGMGEDVTDDGRIIAGCIVNAEAYSDGWQKRPCVWIDGVRMMLPEPKEEDLNFDYNGACAKRISADGSVVLGHLIDNMGIEPAVLWIKDGDTYRIENIWKDRFHPVQWNDLKGDYDDYDEPYINFKWSAVSANGKYAVITIAEFLGKMVDEEWGFSYLDQTENRIGIYNIETQELKIITVDGNHGIDAQSHLTPTAISNDGTVVGYTGDGGYGQARCGFIMKAGEEQPRLFTDAFSNIEQFVTYDINGMNCVTGITSDGRYITGFGYNMTQMDLNGELWDVPVVEGYVLDTNPESGDGISSITDNTKKTAEYFTVNGRKVSAPVKGLNIIKTANGEVKKVIVK